MKTWILATALAVSAIAGVVRAADLDTAPKYTYTFVLDRFQISSKSSLYHPGELVMGGAAYVSLNKKTVKLVLRKNLSCHPNAMCPMYIPSDVEIELPIVAVSRGFCGGIFLFAEEDKRTADGLKRTIQLAHNGRNICSGANDPSVSVTYREVGPFSDEEFVSSMSGEILYKLH